MQNISPRLFLLALLYICLRPFVLAYWLLRDFMTYYLLRKLKGYYARFAAKLSAEAGFVVPVMAILLLAVALLVFFNWLDFLGYNYVSR